MSQGDRITRREFLQKAAVATGLLLAGGWPKLSAAKDETGKAALERRNEQEGMKYRRYGKTNLALSVLGIGGVAIAVEMYPRMIEAGMNYIQYYADPRLPELLKSKELRQRVFIIGQAYRDLGKLESIHYQTRQATLSLVDDLLRQLGVEQIDILNVHIAGYEYFPEHMPETKELLIRSGKIRFLTCSHHNALPGGQDADATLRRFAQTYDGFLGGLSFAQRGQLPTEAFQKYDLGLIAFKPMRAIQWTDELRQRMEREGINSQEAAVRWLLAIPTVTSVVRRHGNTDQLESNLKAIRAPLGETEARFLRDAAVALGPTTCALCGTCTQACPNGVAPATIQQCRLYLEGFHDRSRARRLYLSLTPSERGEGCKDCGACEQACPGHLAIRDSIERLKARLS